MQNTGRSRYHISWEGRLSQGNYFMGHKLTNLIIPGEPDRLVINTPAGGWTFNKAPSYDDLKKSMKGGQVAETYSIECNGTYIGSRSAAMDRADDELIPICLGASFLTALSVAPSRSLPGSDVSFLQVGPHFPRPRAMGEGFQSATDAAMFAGNLSTFVSAYPVKGNTEKIRLISHHFLDALAFWSIEDLALSTTTILEIIAITAKTIAATQGQSIDNFNPRMSFAANRFNLPALPPDYQQATQPGNLGATIFWLKARAGWREKQVETVDGSTGNAPLTIEIRRHGRSTDEPMTTTLIEGVR